MTPHIPRRRSDIIVEDFPSLKDEAVRWLSQWCGDQWTDFNLSDPGVQILEQACYALTELAYRSRLPVEAILQDDRGRIDWDHGAFFAPPRVLPMAPLTAPDYRKLLLDGLDVVYQVWLTGPVDGRHTVWLYLHPDVDGEEAERAAVLRWAAELLDRHRNLGESFDVRTAPAVTFTLEATASLALGRSPADVLAAIYAAVRQSVVVRPTFASIADRQRDGDTLAAMFTGPLLEHGTLSDDKLTPPLSWEALQPLALARAAGVVGVVLEDAKLCIVSGDAGHDGPTNAAVPPAFVFSAGFRRGAPGANRVRFTNAGSEPVSDDDDDDEQVRRLAHGLGIGPVPLSTRLLRGADWTMPRPDRAWSRAAVSASHSMQREFPPNYALGIGEVPPNAPAPRLAQTRQFRGYLLHFEQVMADCLVQLSHLRDLFSTRPQAHTYFTRPLDQVPEALPLLLGFGEALPGGTAADDGRPTGTYARRLRDLTDNSYQFLPRRQRFLDHLLARFGEWHPQTSGPTYATIRNKERLLTALPALSKNRAAGADRRQRWRSGVEEKVALLLQRDPSGEDPPDRAEPPFYYLIEHGTLTQALADRLPAGEAARQALQLTHVLVNWTVHPLNAAFQDHVEGLILENVGAHLVSQFCWFESDRFTPDEGDVGVGGGADLVTFRALHDGWRTAADGVRAQAAAADLFAWLSDPVATTSAAHSSTVGPDGGSDHRPPPPVAS